MNSSGRMDMSKVGMKVFEKRHCNDCTCEIDLMKYFREM